MKHRCNQVLELGFPLGGLAKLFAQEWEGDVTVVMPATLAQVLIHVESCFVRTRKFVVTKFLLCCVSCAVLKDYTKPYSCGASKSG